MNDHEKNKEELILELKKLKEKYSFLEELYSSDVSKKNLADVVLRISEQRFHSLIQNMEAGIVVHAPDTSVVMNNNRASEILGLSEDQMKGKKAIDPAWKFVYENKTPLPIEVYPVNRIVSRKEPIKNQILGINQPDKNQIVWVTVNGFPVLNQSGEITEIVISFIDITERKINEERIFFNEKLLNATQHLTHVGGWEWDVKNQSMLWTDETYCIHDFEKHNVTHGTNDLINISIECYSFEDRPLIESAFHQCIENGIPYDMELRFISAKGRKMWIRTIGNPLFENGIVVKVIGTIMDITDRKNSDEALRMNEAKHSSMISNISDVVGIVSADGIISYLSPNIEKLFGWKTDELIETSGWLTVHPDDLDRIQKEFKTILEKENATTAIEFRYKCKDGNFKPIALTATNLTNDPIIKGVLLNYHDISNRIKFEEEKQKSLDILNETGEIAKIGGWELDLVTGVSTWTNETYRIFEVEQTREVVDEIPKKPKGVDYYAPEFRQIIGQAVQRTIELGEPYDLEVILITEKGNRRWVRTNGRLKQRIGMNKTLTGTIQDITERKMAEEALRMSEAIKSKMVSNIGDVIVIIDENGNNKYKSPNITKLFGWNPEDLVGKNSMENVYHEDLYKGQDFIEKIALVPNAKGTTEIRYKRKDGIYVWIEITLVNLLLDPDIQGLLGNYHDISERKQVERLIQDKSDEIEAQNEEYLQINEELIQTNKELVIAKEHAQESDRLKTAFLQNMSHEIRTPMNAIMGFSELLAKNYNNKPKLEKYSEIINLRCNDLLDIVNDLLDISKIESGQLSVNIEECNLNELFAELTLFFVEQKKRNGKQHINLILKAVNRSNDIVIVTDKVKLKQIFINLIGNALKFTETGTIEGGCKIENNQLLFYVTDTGIGVPLDKQKAIFERFVQLKQGSIKNIGGTGLGLSIVKGLVNLLGGEIFLKSEVGIGSTFSFTLPFKEVNETYHKSLIFETTNDYNFSNKTILIVEDDYYNAEYLNEVLDGLGLNIIQVIYGKEAIEISKSQPIDLVLMDIRLPDMNGYDVTHEIKLIKPEIKIIAQTAYASFDERQKALDAGCNDYISKPAKRNMLLTIVNKYLTKI
jgi:PAS domain S-box-containing protein